ncbi:MAG TPA: cytochrome c oxidase subunit 3 [Microbacterium sp.]|nr:cytochrome c oxidase subunit 3 [Microbacterium sp.]
MTATRDDLPLFLQAGPRPRREHGGPSPARRDSDVPGEPGLWVFIFGDVTLFVVFFAGYLVSRIGSSSQFAVDGAHLEEGSALLNTVVLLTSSLTMACAVLFVRRGDAVRARWSIVGTIGLGLVFAAIKLTEYAALVDDGIVPTTSLFFTYYFVLTGIHLLHVVVGVAVLAVAAAMLRRGGTGGPPTARFADGAAVYWHMVDVIWVALFALLYLVSVA